MTTEYASHRTDAPLAEVLRGGRVESLHTGVIVVSDPNGAIAFSQGDIDAPVFPRSTVKALQALPLIESGAADRFGLIPEDLALACASHGGEPAHAAVASRILGRLGRDQTSLECGAHWPTNAAAARGLAAAGEEPCALHNNCSGKHSGFICVACAEGVDVEGYIRPDHPVMQRVAQTMTEVTGAAHDASNRGVDGCSIPTYAIPMRALALAYARFATGQGFSPDLARAAERLRRAVASAPFMVSGTGGFDTVVMEALGERAFTKIGAEGVLVASLPQTGLGVAIKCRDGGLRGAEAAMAAVLARFGGEGVSDSPVLAGWTEQELRNWNGISVGSVRVAENLRRRLG
ncbi:asparaginase [Acetobacter sp. DsW_063]|uniref:asparaginase n=1 Tax=Acetobacter sp. DsW_063 TaxID=1514894 RepID=UPI000A3BE4D1|nr:asparaginase [Acetobacter sp. DsW_063]OUJ15271.1 asparaginase [Acetobacter sp. DsW_063]